MNAAYSQLIAANKRGAWNANIICLQLQNPFLSIHQLKLYMIANTMRPSLLWIFLLNVYDVRSQCTTNDACWLKNTRGVSFDSSLIPRNSIYPDSCLRFCSHSSECVAATYNPNADTCELHEAGAEGAPCMPLVTDVGSSFWMMKHPERQCPNVRCGIVNAFLNGLTKSVKFAYMEPKYIISIIVISYYIDVVLALSITLWGWNWTL